MSKVFGIGLSGTGTKSLTHALKILGYKAIQYPTSLKDIEKHDAIADISVSCRYKELDVLFPNSKFILTIRDLESWLDSRSRKPKDKHKKSLWVLETRLRTYGVLSYDREIYINVYKKYHEEVQKYFKNRPDDLLIMNIIAGDGWEKLCKFLGKEILNLPFPWVKSAKRRRLPVLLLGS